MSRVRGVRELDLLPGTRVLVRVDYNVPFRPGSRDISDDSRIVASVPTIEYLKSRGCGVILCSHLGRPQGRSVAEYSLAPIARRLSQIIGEEVQIASDSVGPVVEETVRSMRDGAVILLENLRFHPGEENNDPCFARQLADLADCYVNDGFGAAHRKHASTFGVAQKLPTAAGLLMECEIEALSRVTHEPDHPYAVVVGGAKVADKLPVIENLSGSIDMLLIGGGMAGAFLAAAKILPEAWDVDVGEVDLATGILNSATRGGFEVLLPVDVVVADRFAEDASPRNFRADETPAGDVILDIGPETVAMYGQRLAKARTVVWNGPMGVFEWAGFASGTRGVAQAIAGLESAYTVIGGGSTSDAVRSLCLTDRFSHVSTGGGATLEYLQGRELPGIAVLAQGHVQMTDSGNRSHQVCQADD